MTRRYEEVRHAALLTGQTFRAEHCHSGGQLFGRLDCVRNRGANRLYVCIAAVFQRWTYSRLYKEERTRLMDRWTMDRVNEEDRKMELK
jgi:hypothetical protein